MFGLIPSSLSRMSWLDILTNFCLDNLIQMYTQHLLNNWCSKCRDKWEIATLYWISASFLLSFVRSLKRNRRSYLDIIDSKKSSVFPQKQQLLAYSFDLQLDFKCCFVFPLLKSLNWSVYFCLQINEERRKRKLNYETQSKDLKLRGKW